MKCIIIDDEASARLIIGQLCKKVKNLEVVEQFPNALQAMKYLNQFEVDLIFLDIHMPDFNGFDFVQTLKNPPNIILTTSYTKFAIDAFEYDCIVDYLVKPITAERFQKAVHKVSKSKPKEALTSSSYQSSNDHETAQLFINIDRRLIKIDMPTIYLIEAKGDYILIKTENKNYTVHSTLKKIKEKLPESLFLKVHRSYIINLKKIVDIADNSVLIKRDLVPVSRTKRPELMRRLNLL